MWLHTKQRLQDATPDVRAKLERQLDFLEDPLTHIVMLAYLDMQRAVRKMTCKSQEDGATLESVADAVRQCAAWLHRYAIQTTKADGQPSDVVCQLGKWAETGLPPYGQLRPLGSSDAAAHHCAQGWEFHYNEREVGQRRGKDSVSGNRPYVRDRKDTLWYSVSWW